MNIEDVASWPLTCRAHSYHDFPLRSMATYKMRGAIPPSVATQVYSLEAYCMVHSLFLMQSHRYFLNRMKRPPVLAHSPFILVKEHTLRISN